jgi:hypothetical protein
MWGGGSLGVFALKSETQRRMVNVNEHVPLFLNMSSQKERVGATLAFFHLLALPVCPALE